MNLTPEQKPQGKRVFVNTKKRTLRNVPWLMRDFSRHMIKRIRNALVFWLTGARVVELRISIEKDWDIIVANRLREMGFVEGPVYCNKTRQIGYTRRFTTVFLTKQSCVIGTNIEGQVLSVSAVDSPLAHLEFFIEYFDRI